MGIIESLFLCHLKIKQKSMKKLLAIAALTTFIACNDSKKNETISDLKDSTTGTTTTPTESGRAKEISDSTKMLDKMLADSTNKMTPDSLK